MSDALKVATTTDSQAVADAVAKGNDDGGRAEVSESSLAKFEQSADGKVVSFENEQSEHQNLLERLREAEQEIELPVEKADTKSSTEGQPVDESTLGIDLQAIREAATRDALEDARRLHRQVAVPDVDQLRAQLAGPFAQRMQQLRAQTPDIADLDKQSNIPIPRAVEDALLALPGGPEATLHLIRHPEEARQLQQLPEHVAIAKVAQLTARLDPATKRQRSNAPPPISPVGGSSTKSSVPLDQVDYQTYRRARDQQSKERYRR
jgi:hypothetical protein